MRRRYDKQGVLALMPSAFFDLFLEIEETPRNEVRGDCEIVTVRGPLEHHDGWWCDSYESIADRVDVACQGPASTILLRIDSPGGELFGCFDAARSIRARAAAAGKRLIAYVEGCACSAAYALACAAESIVASQTSLIGSIGVLMTRVDVSSADAQRGMRYALVASGKRKVDGNPHAVLSDAELAAMQAQVDQLGALFFELVATLRGKDAAAIAALEAAVLPAAAAVEAGLADRVSSLDDLLATLAGGGAMEEQDKKEEAKEPEAGAAEDLDEARAALERVAEGEGEEAEKARKALRILNGESGEEADDAEETDTAAAASTSAPAARRGASSVSASTAGDLAARVNELSRSVAELRAQKDNLERDQLLAARPDLAKDLVAYLRTKPLAEVRPIVEKIPKPTTAAASRASTAVVPATRGKGEGGPTVDGKATAESPHASALDEAFGLSDEGGGVKRTGNALVFRAPAAVRSQTTSNTVPRTEKGAAK